jgi:hypothetical protein
MKRKDVSLKASATLFLFIFAGDRRVIVHINAHMVTYSFVSNRSIVLPRDISAAYHRFLNGLLDRLEMKWFPRVK